MTTDARQDDISIWEKIGDFFAALSEGFAQLLTKLLGSSNERVIRKMGYVRTRDLEHPYQVVSGSILARINDWEPKMRALSNEELRGMTAAFRQRLVNGESLEHLLPEAFAAVREAGRRYKDMRHFDVQMLGGIVLHQGKIAEMVTGEGKTLVATLPAYLNGLEGQGVHIVTVNDYLARRDCEWMLPIYQGLGMTAGAIQTDMDPGERRKAYDCDITYGTNSEFGFDYLRDNMRPARWGDPHYPVWQQQCQKKLHYAIIDEVDNILIDEARTPLIISGQAHGDVNRFMKADQIARQLKPSVHFEIKEKERTCHLTEEGIHEAERLAGVESFYTAGNMEWPHLLDNALKAHHLYKRDKQYVVMPHPETGEISVIIVDEFTGRLMVGRQWSDGLHQAVEAKESAAGVKIKEETQTLATITLQNFFKLYKKLAGMTGTAMTEANEFWKIYKLEVVAIPTNKPLRRVNYPDVIFLTEKEKWKAVIDEIVEVHETGRPILVGTVDVEKSERLGEMLKRRGIKFELLNAKPEYAEREGTIVAQAGRLGAVTIATNMAGRGTDIILGGNPEYLAWEQLKRTYATRLDVPPDVWKATVDAIEAKEKTKEEGRKVAEMGGLHIIGTERHDARRIDNQLRGRAGRQGDPGSSRFYLSLEDDLMRIFAGDWVKAMLQRLGMKEGEAIESRMVSRRIEAAQKKVEERHFDARKHLLEYDEVMDHQRKRTYGYRQEVLEGANCRLLILDMLREQVGSNVERFTADNYGVESFAEFASARLGVEFDASDFSRSSFSEACSYARDKAIRHAATALQEQLEENVDPEADPREWNWEALAKFVGARWGIKTSARELKQIGREQLIERLLPQAEAAVEAVDLSEGERLLRPDFGRQSICDWLKHKFQIDVPLVEIVDQEPEAIKELIWGKVNELYVNKDVDFPAKVGIEIYMADRAAFGTQKYDRDGLYQWAKQRFAAAADQFAFEQFRSEPKSRLFELLRAASRRCYPADGPERIDSELAKYLNSEERLSEEQAREVASWAHTALQLEIDPATLIDADAKTARHALCNAFDEKYRPEMRSMERSLILNTLDAAWKDHLYVMDHLRSGIGLVGYAQVDPKTEYKREGMKLFEQMWNSVHARVTDLVFRMEEVSHHVAEDLWRITETRHEAAGRLLPAPSGMRGEQEAAIAGSQQSEKKIDPIRRRGLRIGRNDPCPCGSGKKYKNCCMRTAV